MDKSVLDTLMGIIQEKLPEHISKMPDSPQKRNLQLLMDTVHIKDKGEALKEKSRVQMSEALDVLLAVSEIGSEEKIEEAVAHGKEAMQMLGDASKLLLRAHNTITEQARDHKIGSVERLDIIKAMGMARKQ